MKMVPLPRHRVGLIIPSANRVVESELHRHFPPEFALHVTRLRMTGEHELSTAGLLAKVREASALLGDAGCDVLGFHCQRASMQDGSDGDRQIRDAMTGSTGCKAISTGSAMAHALNALDATKVVLVTPFVPEKSDHETAVLEALGFEVVGGRGLGLRSADEYAAVAPEAWMKIAVEERTARADAYVLSCTTIRTMEIIAQLEDAVGRPVVTSNQALLWESVRCCGVGERLPGLGRLGELGLAVA